MGTGVGAKISLDGAASFSQAMKLAAAQAKTLKSELASVASQFAATDKSEVSLTKQNEILARSLTQAKERVTVLNGELQKQKSRLTELSSELEKATNKQGNNQKEVIAAQTAYSKQALAVERLETQYHQAQTEVSQMTRKVDENNSALRDVQRGYDDAGKKVDEFGNELGDAEKKSISFADVLKANLLSKIIFDGLKKLASLTKDFAKSMIETAASVKAETAQFEQTFGNMQTTASSAIGRVASDAGILDTRLRATGTSIYAFAKAAGADSAEALDIMERALVVAADSAAYYDKSLEDTSESLRSFLKGNYANDAALGVSATETTRNAKANELFGQSFKNLSESQKQVTLLAMVEEANQLSGALGQASRESDGYENVMGNLNETWRKFKALVGGPFLESLIPIVEDITAAFQKWMEDVDWEAFSEAINGAVRFIIDNKDTILGAVGGVAAAFIGWNVGSMIGTLVASIQALIAPTTGAAGATRGLNSAMKANPIGLILALVATLVTTIMTLWATNEDFRNGVIAIWEAIKEGLSIAVEAIADFFTKTLPDAFMSAVEWLKNLPSKIIGAIEDAISGIVTWGADMGREALSAAKGVFDNIVDTIKGLPEKMLDIGGDIVRGLWDGIQNMANWLGNKISGFGSWVVGGFKDAFGTHSPSKVLADEVGVDLPPGIAVGFDKALPAAVQSMKSGAKGISAALSSAIPAITSAAYASYSTLPNQTAPTNNSDISFVININANTSPQDAPAWEQIGNDLVERISEKIESITRRKQVAYG